MKAQSIFLQTFRLVLSGAVCLFFSCTSDDPESVPSSSSGSGEVSFELVTEGGSGSGSSSSPFEVAMGETFGLSISQQSRYTDTDGTVFECEPTAGISLSTTADTVYAEDLQQLTAVLEPKVKSSSDGGNPTHYSVTQEFPIGGQSVVFDLSYEVYEYTTVSGKSVEMPYVKPDQAKMGSSSASESRGGAVVKNITVKPLVQSRASVSDTTWYEVNAVFSLDVECMNSQVENTRNLVFSVTFRGAVTKEIELGDPKAELSSTVDVLGGTSSVSSPYVVNPKEQMSLLFRQNSSYIDAYGNKMVCEPQARINLFAQYDTVYVSKLEELEVTPASQDFVFTESGEDPVLYSTVQLFKLGIQMVQLDMSYETYTAIDVENNEITMPYLKQNATMPGAVTVNEISTATGAKADTTFYNVKFPITLETVDVGTPDENIQTIELVVSYIGAIVTWKDEPELVKVEYRTGYVWEEAHDNLPLLYYAHVFRDRYYSNGEVITDTFVDAGHPADVIASVNTRLDEYPKNYPSEGTYFYEIENNQQDYIEYKAGDVFENDSVRIIHCSATISGNPADSKTDLLDGERNGVPGDWDSYLVSKLYDSSLNLETDLQVNTQYPSSSRESGWYFQNLTYGSILYIFLPNDMKDIFTSDLNVNQYDQYLSIDGKRIDFTEYYPERENKFSTESISGGVRYTHECIVKFMGRNFYSSCVMDVTQR